MMASTVKGLVMTPHQVCSPGPVSSSYSAQVWSDITILAEEVDAAYKVCWNAGLTYQRADWFEVPGYINVPSSYLKWSLADSSAELAHGAADNAVFTISR